MLSVLPSRKNWIWRTIGIASRESMPLWWNDDPLLCWRQSQLHGNPTVRPVWRFTLALSRKLRAGGATLHIFESVWVKKIFQPRRPAEEEWFPFHCNWLSKFYSCWSRTDISHLPIHSVLSGKSKNSFSQCFIPRTLCSSCECQLHSRHP